MKELKDYLHLYLGCELQIIYPFDPEHPSIEKFTGFNGTRVYTNGDQNGFVGISECKPILRPLIDMTEDEKREAEALEEILAPLGDPQYSGESIRFWLSKNFDLFGLIEAGLAIDKTKIQ